MTLYFISGLGADRRLFRNLQLPACVNVRHLDWIQPQPGESLPSYGLRLADAIDKTEPFGLVGLSFGGMLAAEIAKVHPAAICILISSAARPAELPAFYRLLGKLRVNRLVPLKMYKEPNVLMFWYFGAKTKEEKDLLRGIVRDSDPVFVQWAVDSILRWKNETLPEGLFRIHGTADRVIPIRNVTAQHAIPKGSHLIVYSQAAAVSRAISLALGNQGFVRTGAARRP